MVNTIIKTIRKYSDREASEIGLESSFNSLGFDDHRFVELVMELEDMLGFSANMDIYGSETIAELVNLIKIECEL